MEGFALSQTAHPYWIGTLFLSLFFHTFPLGEIKPSPYNFMYDVALPHPPLHFDPNICT